MSTLAASSAACSELRAMGGLYEAQAVVHRPTDVAGARALFERARHGGPRLTLSAARRSFGEHFLPLAGGDVVDTRGLGGAVEVLSREHGGPVIARIPASHSFEALFQAIPSALPWHPPTGDQITVGGAVAACTHDSTGYLADDLRAVHLLTARGEQIRCAADAGGLAAELFELLPGSFGALGWITHVELGLRPIAPETRVQIEVLYAGAARGFTAVDRLEQIYRDGQYPLGRGLFFYGCRNESVLVGDSLMDDRAARLPRLPLTDDATVKNIVLQGIAHRIPAVVHRLQPRVLREGRRFEARMYGFCYYQRSYDRAYDWLSSARASSRLLRALGVDPRLTVCHQSFAIAPDRIRPFLTLYFEELARSPRAIRGLEQQDLVRLPPCRWPLHGTHGMSDGAYLFTPSFSVRRESQSHREVQRCLSQVSERAFHELGVKVLLLKQVHCRPEVLRRMHGGFIERVQELRAKVDPDRVLGSRLLETLGVA